MKADLRKVPFLQPLTDVQAAQLADRGRQVPARAGEVLFNKGDSGDCMYAILAGSVQIYLDDREGHKAVLGVLEAGDFFGEMALLDGDSRSASAAAITDCELFRLDRDAFLDLLATSPALRSQLLIDLAQRIRVTDERYLQEEIARQTLRADIERERHRALAQMVAGVAHEVNTPLGIINTAASIMKRELTSDTAVTLAAAPKAKALFEDLLETTDLMQRNITRAHGLIQSFKTLSISEVADTKETLALPEVINEILALFSIQARQAGLEVEFKNDLPPDQQSWVGFRGVLSRVLLNLLTNVERYAYPAGTGGNVTVGLTLQERLPAPSFALTVRDWGAGISAEHLPRIFEPFFTTGRGRGGAGLGLAMVYNLVTAALHGTIEATSVPGEGTTITVTFPQVVPA
ncbi:MAG TPA: cyclic nucleotide-binding domain-containing protein [Terriglobia bacterium]